MLHESVTLIHVDIDEQLAREIPERQTFMHASNSAGRHSLVRQAGTETGDNFGDESEDSLVGNV